MKIISKAYEPVLTILKRFQKKGSAQRMIKYCVQLPTADGVLLFNLLTRELVLLEGAENESLMQLEYLRERWFTVSVETDEKELVDFVRLVLMRQRKQPTYITKYLIYTTTDCNARCFYCFQRGRSRIPMSQETAQSVVRYIKNHCGGEVVKLTWFGGEPLFNATAIDVICESLRREGVRFTSSMATNGYLLDDEMVCKAVEEWNLKILQIAMDGTEKNYNRSKAYIYQEGNPYQIVIGNIQRALDAGISVSIRLNMDLYNAQDLIDLVDELAQNFDPRKGLSIYASHLFQEGKTMEQLHSEEGWNKRREAMDRLMDRIEQYGMESKRGIKKYLSVNACKADSGDTITIAPTGDIGLCDHYSESEFIGHIDREEFEQKMVEDWHEMAQELPDCQDCFYYPECMRLKKCNSASTCSCHSRYIRLSKIQRQMRNEYDQWKNQTEGEDEELIEC